MRTLSRGAFSFSQANRLGCVQHTQAYPDQANPEHQKHPMVPWCYHNTVPGLWNPTILKAQPINVCHSRTNLLANHTLTNQPKDEESCDALLKLGCSLPTHWLGIVSSIPISVPPFCTLSSPNLPALPLHPPTEHLCSIHQERAADLSCLHVSIDWVAYVRCTCVNSFILYWVPN